jgi:hypothetical protein
MDQQQGWRQIPQPPSSWKPLNEALVATVSLGIVGELGCLLAFGTADPLPFILAGEVALTPLLVVGAMKLAYTTLFLRRELDQVRPAPAVIEAEWIETEPEPSHSPLKNLVVARSSTSHRARRDADMEWIAKRAATVGLGNRQWEGARLPSGQPIDRDGWQTLVRTFEEAGLAEPGAPGRAARLTASEDEILQSFGLARTEERQ